MNCSNEICNKSLKNIGIVFTCQKCQKKTCSSRCLNAHMASEHQEQHQRQIRASITRSIFIKKGEIIKQIIDDPYYDLKNFEFVRGKTNKVIAIGAGSFGQVYLAKHNKDGKLYAIKYIKKEKVISAQQSLDIIYREILLQRSFVHDNIVRLYHFVEDKEKFFMIMEYMQGGTLFSLIRKNKGFEEKEAFKYFIQVCSAIYFLHENGYAHRDLKPENLLLDDKGNLKLCDFGWCVDVSSGERATFCGTYEYMAPEIVKEIPYDQSIDIWSLGVLLYELIHGYSPFRAAEDKKGDNYEEIFKNIVKHKYVIEKDISKNCENLIAKMLNPEHKERIKIREIFVHPWVVEFEKEYKKRKIKEEMESKEIKSKDKISQLVTDLIEKEPEKINTDSNHSNNMINKNKISIPKIEDTDFTIFKDNVFENTMKTVESKKKKIIKSESLNNKKIDDNEFSLFNNIQQESNKDEPVISHSKTHIEKKEPKKDKLFIEQDTPTPDGDRHTENLKGYVGLLEKANNIHKEQEKREVPKIKNEESFWDKFLSPFKCGSSD